MAMCNPTAPRRQQLTAELRAERTARELRLVREAPHAPQAPQGAAPQAVELPIPGEAAGPGVRLRATLRGSEVNVPVPAKLRGPRAGDRVRLRHSRNARPLKEIFERLQVEGERRRTWLLLEWNGRIVWMQGVDVDPEIDLPFEIEVIGEEAKERDSVQA
jgi:tRNA(Ile)-lysidine synthase